MPTEEWNALDQLSTAVGSWIEQAARTPPGSTQEAEELMFYLWDRMEATRERAHEVLLNRPCTCPQESFPHRRHVEKPYGQKT